MQQQQAPAARPPQRSTTAPSRPSYHTYFTSCCAKCELASLLLLLLLSALAHLSLLEAVACAEAQGGYNPAHGLAKGSTWASWLLRGALHVTAGLQPLLWGQQAAQQPGEGGGQAGSSSATTSTAAGVLAARGYACHGRSAVAASSSLMTICNAAQLRDGSSSYHSSACWTQRLPCVPTSPAAQATHQQVLL
jgi:hypothetical protein